MFKLENAKAGVLISAFFTLPRVILTNPRTVPVSCTNICERAFVDEPPEYRGSSCGVSQPAYEADHYLLLFGNVARIYRISPMNHVK